MKYVIVLDGRSIDTISVRAVCTNCRDSIVWGVKKRGFRSTEIRCCAAVVRRNMYQTRSAVSRAEWLTSPSEMTPRIVVNVGATYQSLFGRNRCVRTSSANSVDDNRLALVGRRRLFVIGVI